MLRKRNAEKLREHTERVALELYYNRLLLGRPGDERSDWAQAEKIVRSPIRTALFASHRPLIKLEKRLWEPSLAWANDQAILSLLGLNVQSVVAAFHCDHFYCPASAIVALAFTAFEPAPLYFGGSERLPSSSP